MMSKTISTRLPKETHENLVNRCNNLGCTVNDYLKASMDFALTGNSEFNFDELDVKPIESTGNSPRPEYRTKPRVRIDGIPSGKAIPQISYDGKTWIDCPQNEVKSLS